MQKPDKERNRANQILQRALDDVSKKSREYSDEMQKLDEGGSDYGGQEQIADFMKRLGRR